MGGQLILKSAETTNLVFVKNSHVGLKANGLNSLTQLPSCANTVLASTTGFTVIVFAYIFSFINLNINFAFGFEPHLEAICTHYHDGFTKGAE